MVIQLEGVIRNVRYTPHLSSPLHEYDFNNFDINAARGQGIVTVGANPLGFSKWISPKRTRSYPYARIYDTYGLGKRVTIIPVIKDEGVNGDNDRINIVTLSLMNLLNVFVILAWYEDAKPHAVRDGKIAGQLLPPDYVRERVSEINSYQQTALHWNLMHFGRDFEQVYRQAVDSYQRISQKLGVPVHSKADHLNVLKQFLVDGQFDVNIFRDISLARSKNAASRETLTHHLQEFLQEGDKAALSLTNYLGGEYHLTVDEVFAAGDRIVLQESKNTTRHSLPSLNDIKDGLLKLILYNNIDELSVDGIPMAFEARLKLTGKIIGSLTLPANELEIAAFAHLNAFTKRRQLMLDQLNLETRLNSFRIDLMGNQ